MYVDDTLGLSAQLAYYFILSIFPVMIIVVTLLPYLPFTDAQFMHAVDLFVPDNAAKFVQKILLEVISHQKKPIIKEPAQFIRSPQKCTKPPRNYQA